MKRHKIGVIGLGARGETFVRQLCKESTRAELFGLCDIDQDRMDKFCAYCELPDARRFTNPDEFFSRREMDAVIITTPDFTHRDVAIAAMKAGKHIYLEKPMAVNAGQCRDIIRAQRETGVTAFVGFNLRAHPAYQRIKQVMQSGILGQIVHIEGLEQLSIQHSASFMRRFHRKRQNTGGFLNHKCSHDLDIIQWLIGHEHKVVKVASFAGLNVFVPKKAPAKYCSECPEAIYRDCLYKDQAGFVFPIGHTQPLHHRQNDIYGGDLCVYTGDKDTFDNQTVILEWDNGVRGNFNLQLFQSRGCREQRIWGELGVLRLTAEGNLRTTLSHTNDIIDHCVTPLGAGGHDGTDTRMIGRFVDAIEGQGADDSGLAQGMAATIVAQKALESVLSGQVMTIRPEEYQG